MNSTDKISDIFSSLGATAKSLAKILLQSRHTRRADISPDILDKPLIILGNGPSLRHTIDSHLSLLQTTPCMAVNFAAITDEFQLIRPRFYILADPHFFVAVADANVDRLWRAIADADWPITLFVPASRVADARHRLAKTASTVGICSFNPIGVEGFGWFERWAYRNGLGMPRPRNVLIPAIMTGIRAGFRKIIIVGADHSWMQTLAVDSDNRVVSVQPHFYNDNADEHKRVATVYSGVKLHDVVHSFYVAFRAYHRIADYAAHAGITIINATPDSMIDAFMRAPL